MDAVWLLMPALAGTIFGTILCLPFTRRVKPIWVAVTCLYFVLDTVIVLKAPPISDTHWNWSGKLLSTLFGLLILYSLKLFNKEVGFVLPKMKRSWHVTVVGTIAAIVFSGCLNYFFRDHRPAGIETLLYQATVPGLSEEIAYRGVGYALIQRAFGVVSERWTVVPSILIPSLVFGFGHGWSRDNGVSHFMYVPFLFSLFLGLWFAWIRLRSGSLLGAITAHNLANVAGSWLSGLR